MSTSLAEQLRRLQTPQTAALHDKKRFPSLLFDPKEAAEKDRQTIYEIGISGLEELIQIDSSFLQFRESLFDRGSLQLQRAIEDKAVNKQLSKVIKSFMYHVSPYFMLQPSHKCLEWLIRRFSIQDYNKDEFFSLILPYHETRIAVRCIQTMSLSNPNDKWHWCLKVKKTGEPLSKQAIVNHAIGSPAFLTFISTYTYEAVKELNMKANNLQVMFNFYTIVTISMLDTPNIKESHILALLKPITRGIDSGIIDFSALSYMIISQMLKKLQLSKKILEKFALAGVSPSSKPANKAAVMMIMIMFQTQQDFTAVSDELLEKLLESKWLVSVLEEIYSKNLDILSFLTPLMKACFKHIQDMESPFMTKSKILSENLLNGITYNSKDAEILIKIVLESYVLEEKEKKGEKFDASIIELDSDDDEMKGKPEKAVTEWYSNFLKSLERQYPAPFDRVVHEIVSKKKSKKKRNALKNVLDFLLKVSCSQDEGNMFEYLYDFNSERRVQAVKFVVTNFDHLNSTSGGNNLLKSALLERFDDDEPSVLIELFKLKPENLLKLLSVHELLTFCGKILAKCLEMPLIWGSVTTHVLSFIIQKEIILDNEQLVMLLIFPFMSPSINDTKFKILDGKYTIKLENAPKKLSKCVQAIIEGSDYFPGNITKTLPIFENFTTKSEAYALHKAVYLINGLKNYTDPVQGQNLLEIVKNCVQNIDTAEHRQALLLTTIDIISKNIRFEPEDNNLSIPGSSLKLKLTLFNLLLTKLVMSENLKDRETVNISFKDFLNNFCKTFEEKLDFLSLYFTADCVTTVNTEEQIITPQLQFYVLKITLSILKNHSHTINLTKKTFIRLLMTLASQFSKLREAAFEVFCVLNNLKDDCWKFLIQKLVERREELVIDHEQLPLILFNVFGSGTKKSLSEKKSLKECFASIVDPIQSFENYEISRILLMLKHIKDSDTFEKISGIGISIVDCVKQENMVVLGRNESQILKEIVSRIDKDTIKLSTKHPHIWQFILETIKCDALLQLSDQKSISVAQKTLEMFDKGIYKTLTEKYRREWFQTVIETSTFSNNVTVHTTAGKMFKDITIEAKIVLEMLELMKAPSVEAPPLSNKEKRRSLNNSCTQVDMLQTANWKQGVTILEFLQTKLQVDKPLELVVTLFELLKLCFEFEEHSLVEYEKQLILTAILNSCKGPIPVNKQKTLDKIIKIDLIIECVRGTHNSQTHQDALLLLSHVASLIPEQVLQNIVGIFTFMGSSVARHDDTYSFQVMSKVIENVIPIVVAQQKGKDKVVSVLKIFADIILDVAMHRRMIVYTKLLETLGPNQYLWQFLAVLFESHIRNYDKDPKNKKKTRTAEDDSDELPERLEAALSISKQFPCEVVVNTCTNLMKFLSELPFTEEDMKSHEISKDISLIFDTKHHNFKQIRFFKYATLQFLNAILTSQEVVKAAEDIDDVEQLKLSCTELIAETLKYVPAITKVCAGQTHQRYWKIALSYCFDILESSICLLTPHVFIETVRDLIENHELITVKMKIIEMLITKLQSQKDYFDECGDESLLALIEPLTSIIKKIGCDSDLPKNSSISEYWALQQLALSAVKLLARILAEDDPTSFKELLEISSEKLIAHETICDKVLGTLVLCVAELCSTLKVQAITYLPKVSPIILKILESKNASKPDLVLLSIVAAISKIVEFLVQFLSPYLTPLIIHMSRVYTEALACTHPDVKTNHLLVKMKHIWHNLASTVPSRVIIPAINNSCKDIVKRHSFRAVGPIMDLITECFEHIPAQEFSTLQNELTSFFVKALQFRCDRRVTTTDKVTEKDMEVVEEHVIRAFTALILKLSESSFRPLYFKIHNWALVEAGASRERGITFFKLSHAISDALKGLFILFASDLIEPMSKLMIATNPAKTADLYYETPDKNSVLIEYVLKTLKSVCTYDSQKFINAHRFGLLMEPLIDTVENPFIMEKDELKLLLQETIGAFTVAAADDTLWKQLNLYLLEKMRCDDPEQKLYALHTCIEVARRLGEDFLQLLPETIPFFAELMESDVHEVERGVQRALQELEKIVGEDLQKYF